MPGPYPFGETVVRHRFGESPGRDERGQPIPGPLLEEPIEGVAVVPRAQAPDVGGEQQQYRDQVFIGYTLYLPAGTDVVTTDRLMVRGELHEVTGFPGDWGRSPFTGSAGPVQVAVDRVKG